jgi:very-short-patch-repair endonuclease
MSLNSKQKLTETAKLICRELRKNPTKAERMFWEMVRNKKFLGKKFYRQYPIFHDLSGKETFFIADFFCFEGKLVVELDGKYHLYRLKEDEERTKILNHLGLEVIRFSNENIIKNINKVVHALEEKLNEA